MWEICIFVILLSSFSAHGNHIEGVTPCISPNLLSGNWYNELGSELVVSHIRIDTQTGVASISGEFRSAVERFNGSSGSAVPVMKGIAKLNEIDRLILGFTVVHNDGLSTTSFIGECVVCNGEEALLMTWILRKHVSDPRDRWQATLIGQNTFTHQDRIGGPRKADPYKVSKRPAIQSLWDESENSRIQARFERSETSIEGKWFSSRGTELDLSFEDLLTGNYSNPPYAVNGPPVHPYTKGTLGFSALGTEDNLVKVWVGQLLQKPNGEDVLDTSYLQYTGLKSCDDFKGPVLYGNEEFTRTKNSGGFFQKPNQTFFERFKSSMSSIFSYFY